MRFGVIILAAGPSSRMGTPKQLLEIGGKPLLVRTVEAALASHAWPVIVVLGANEELIRPALASHPVLVAENAAWSEGMASSIREGIVMLQQFSRAIDAVVLTVCDQPAFTAQTIAQLVTAQCETGRSIVAARYDGRRGTPALFLQRHFETLAGLTGEEGARSLLKGADPDVTDVDLPELAFDLDTPADYDAASRALSDRRQSNGLRPLGGIEGGE